MKKDIPDNIIQEIENESKIIAINKIIKEEKNANNNYEKFASIFNKIKSKKENKESFIKNFEKYLNEQKLIYNEEDDKINNILNFVKEVIQESKKLFYITTEVEIKKKVIELTVLEKINVINDVETYYNTNNDIFRFLICFPGVFQEEDSIKKQFEQATNIFY